MSCHLGPIEIVPPKGETAGAFKAKITLKNAGKLPFELKNDAVPFIDKLLLIEVYDSTGTMLFREDNISYHSPYHYDPARYPTLSIPPGQEKSGPCSFLPALGFGRLPPGKYSVRAFFPFEEGKYYPSNLVRFELKEDQKEPGAAAGRRN